MTDAQVAILDAWFIGDAYHGAVEFTYTDNRTSVSQSYRWLGVPTYARIGPDLWDVSCSWEMVP